MFQVAPLGIVCLCAASYLVTTHTLTFQQMFMGFSTPAIWLVVFAFFISRTFTKTKLGERLALALMLRLGRYRYGIPYAMVLGEFLTALTIPSASARCGGVSYPITTSIAQLMEKRDQNKRLGAYLVLLSTHSASLASTLTMTSTAGNPLIVEFLKEAGLSISWLQWFLGALVPNCICALLLPLGLKFLAPVRLKVLQEALPELRERYAMLGPMSQQQKKTIGILSGMVVLWSLGGFLALHPATAALIGVCALWYTGALEWEDIVEEKSAWEAMLWFGTLFSMAAHLNRLGVANYLGDLIASTVGHCSWPIAMLVLCLSYYLIHYFFASAIAQLSALFTVFLFAGVQLGAPILLHGMSLAYISHLYSGLTPYASGCAAIMFSSGYVSSKLWWLLGHMMLWFHIIIWFGTAFLWWKILGWW